MFDINFNRLGIIDGFIATDLTLNYDTLSDCRLTVDGTKDYADLLQIDHIITKTADITRGYIIKTREYLDEASTELKIIAYSMNLILNDRLVLGQQEFTGTIENVMKSFVQVNAVSPTNPNRMIPNLVIASNRGIPIETTEGAVNVPLDEYLYELCKKHDVSFDIFLDHENKKFVFDVWQGVDRSTVQSNHAHVTFAKEFDNVLKQHYTESNKDHRTTAIVLGETVEGKPQSIITVNDDQSGFNRKEMVVEATDIRKSYTDDKNNQINLTEAEYQSLLTEKGKNTLSEHQGIKTFESDVDPQGNYIYGLDYSMGDKVSTRNDDLGIILHTRIMSVIEKENKQGETIQLNFGSNIPSFIEKVKRAVKK
ncbi:siphovirus ReqiPepy6 Gp37-like family protein [Peribacillus loiseleuriae]|uniref:siphovirus ReqiPepy6 Gp37-like family protein n=1 Tax=Peribacillus loiseleuriae TaxID=1679170 RepID=UPI0015D5749C|nr:siphovirus ReqiPepy6 Gp37-like family protein [Peribacillus loiseleuriae]